MSEWMYMILWALEAIAISGGFLLGFCIPDWIENLKEKRKNSKKAKKIDR